MTMLRLAHLLSGIADVASAQDVVVSGLALDSRAVRAGDAFVALRGGSAHGITFAPAALAQGASAVIAEAPAPAATPQSAAAAPDESGAAVAGHASDVRGAAVPTIWIEGLRDHVGEIAARFFGRPSAALHLIGVTGTNGKTSIVQLLASALTALGQRAATIGTLGAGLAGAIRAGERTTPDAVSVQSLLAEFRDAGATHVAMEVSSHALEQGRVNAVGFDIAVFTNLTRDHLDYHGTMQDYGAAKAKLFAWPELRAAVINADDAFGVELAQRLAPGVQRLRYAVDAPGAEIRATQVRSSAAGLSFELTTPWGAGTIASPLLGRFNVYNLLAVAGCLGALGYTFAQIHNALARLEPVAGRMNRLGGADGPLVVIDYAHTPDALQQALTSLRAHCDGRLVCVFGCGGERDRGKRPQMGAIAEQLADRIIITDDNPRGEDGDAIVAQIAAGLAHRERATIERDRAKAISLALTEARVGDVVLIAGKGHEPYQEIAGRKVPFDDFDIARRTLESLAC